MQVDKKKTIFAIILILLFTSFALTACENKKEEEFGDKIVKEVVKGYMDMKKEARNNNSVEEKKEVVVEEPRDAVSGIMTARLEKMYDLVGDPLSGGYMKENFPDLQPIYTDVNGTFIYYHTELADSTFKYWVRLNKVIAIKQGRRMGFD
jgi:hypothetical protein